MKTEILYDPDVGIEMRHHSLPLASQLNGAGHIGFINRIPRETRTSWSFFLFTIKDATMHGLQIPSPGGVPLAEGLSNLKAGVDANPELMRAVLDKGGTYVGFAVIFPMKLLGSEHGYPTVETIHTSPKAIQIPGVIVTHEGSSMAARYARRGIYLPFPKAAEVVDAGGTSQAIQEVHSALCHVADMPPNRGRRLRDMYRDD